MPLRHEINGIAGLAPQRIARLRGEAQTRPISTPTGLPRHLRTLPAREDACVPNGNSVSRVRGGLTELWGQLR